MKIKVKIFLIIYLSIFYSCQILVSNIKLSKNDILQDSSYGHFIAYSKDDALQIIRDFYQNKGSEKDIDKYRFYYLKYWNTSSSYGHLEVKFSWKTIKGIEVRELRWNDGTGIYKIIIYFPVIKNGKRKIENFEFATINIDDKDKLVRIVSALYILSELNYFAEDKKILNGPENEFSALLYGKITIESSYKFSTIIFLLQKKGDELEKILVTKPDKTSAKLRIQEKS